MKFSEIFCSKTTIKMVSGEPKIVGKQGPSGVHCKNAPANTSRPAKYNSAAVFLETLLYEKKIFVAFGPNNSCYCEFNGKKAVFDGFTVSWANTPPENLDEQFFPVFAYALSGITKGEEYVSLFKEIKKEIATSGVADPINVLKFCDTFYYSFKSVFTEIPVDSDLIESTIEQGFATGQYNIPSLLSDIAMPIPPMAAKGSHKSEKENDVTLEEAKNGSYLISYKWNEEQQKNIPKINTLDDFEPSATFYSLIKKAKFRLEKCLFRMDSGKEGIEAIGHDYINNFLVGKPGSGKTTLLYALGAALGMPVYTITFSKNTEEDQFEGKTKIVEGKLTFLETDFLYAYEHGGIIILEEANLIDAGVSMGALGQAIEFPFILMRDGYEPIRRHPLCMIFGTFNVGTDGSRPINQAFSSRFKSTYMLDDPDKASFIRILNAQGHGLAQCKWVYMAYVKILKYLEGPEVNKAEYGMNITLRGCLGALENMEEGDNPKEAICNSLIGKIAEVDLETAKEVKKNVLDTLPEKDFA